jgi:hypothetical protein
MELKGISLEVSIPKHLCPPGEHCCRLRFPLFSALWLDGAPPSLGVVSFVGDAV